MPTPPPAVRVPDKTAEESVLLVRVCVPVNVATVESIATVTADDPLKLVPESPVPMVNAFVVVPAVPQDTVLPSVVRYFPLLPVKDGRP